jgi:ParB family chromosome partitioning protein
MALDLSALDGWELNPKHRDGGSAPRAVLSLIEEDPENARFEDAPEDFAALVEDVRAHGILQPIVVRRLAGGKLRIRFGARRYRAAVHLGLPDVPYVVTEDPRQFDDYAQVAENERRTALQPLELATFIAKKLQHGDSKAKIAARLGIHPSALTHMLCLVGDVPPILLELYHSRRCRTIQYLYRLGRLWKVDARRVEEACAGMGEIDGRMILALESTAAEPDSKQPPVAGTSSAKTSEVIDSRPAKNKSESGKGSHHASPIPVADSTHSLLGPPAGRFRKPQLFGTLDGKEVEIDLVNRSSSPGQAIVRFTDELIVAEVDLSSLIVIRLVDAP